MELKEQLAPWILNLRDMRALGLVNFNWKAACGFSISWFLVFRSYKRRVLLKQNVL